MPLTEQERRCMELACTALANITGGDWTIDEGSALDDLHPNEPTPEGIVTNGSRTAAVEVKRLTGDSVWNTYYQSLHSLQRSLAPETGGHWVLIPCNDFRLPMDATTRKRVKKQIASLGHLRDGDDDVIRIQRSARISLIRADGPGHVWCCHTSSGHDELREASSLVEGNYFVVDDGQWEHSFVTDEGRQGFVRSLVEACARRVSDGESEARWDEEWELLRGEDLQPGEVDIVCVTEARSVPGGNAEAVDLVLDSALRKFEERQWGDFHVIVLDRAGPGLVVDHLLDAIRSYPEDVFEAIDLILVTKETESVEGWRSARIGAE